MLLLRFGLNTMIEEFNIRSNLAWDDKILDFRCFNFIQRRSCVCTGKITTTSRVYACTYVRAYMLKIFPRDILTTCFTLYKFLIKIGKEKGFLLDDVILIGCTCANFVLRIRHEFTSPSRSPRVIKILSVFSCYAANAKFAEIWIMKLGEICY